MLSSLQNISAFCSQLRHTCGKSCLQSGEVNSLDSFARNGNKEAVRLCHLAVVAVDKDCRLTDASPGHHRGRAQNVQDKRGVVLSEMHIKSLKHFEILSAEIFIFLSMQILI